MILEAFVLEALKGDNHCLTSLLGKWDYVSHQVVASPFKPADYAEHIDVFCIRYIKHKEVEHVPCGFLVLELKKDELSFNRNKKKNPMGGEVEETLNQLMKYVDWVCHEYAHDDYRLIKAAIIGKDFILGKANDKNEQDDRVMNLRGLVTRHSLTETHPIRHEQWSDISLIKYNIEKEKDELSFELKVDLNLDTNKDTETKQVKEKT